MVSNGISLFLKKILFLIFTRVATLNKCFWAVINAFEVTPHICWNLYTLILVQSVPLRCNTVRTSILFDVYLKLHKDLFSKIKGMLSYMGVKKNPIPRDKNLRDIWNLSLTHKNEQHYNAVRDLVEWIVVYDIRSVTRSCLISTTL